MHDASGIVGLHAAAGSARAARHADVDQRLLVAGAEASDAGEIEVGAAAIDGLGEGVVQAFRAIAAAAGAHADGDARNRQATSLARPASRTALNAPMSSMRGITHSPVPASALRAAACAR